LGQFLSPPPHFQTEPIQENQIRTCFTPGGACEALIVDEIEDAKSSIRVQAYSFTSKPITQALLDAHKRGVNIKFLCDRSQKSERYSRIKELEANGIPVSFDNVEGLAHNKTIIIDDEIVITGSYNFTYSAQNRNSENLLIIRNKKVVNSYVHNWLLRARHTL